MLDYNANKTVKGLKKIEIDKVMSIPERKEVQDIVSSANIPMYVIQGYDILKIATLAYCLGKMSK